ncbi:MAG: hypothetical protein JXR78_16175 [Victivallales bacterium]|nr:hypothetical protein [Victivallales bacterium]
MCKVMFFCIALCSFPFIVSADDLSQIIKKIQATETVEKGDASIGAIEFAQKRFYEEFFMTMFESLPLLSKEKQKILINREIAMAQRLRYAIWEMCPQEWTIFKNRYADEKLVLFESVNCLSNNDFILGYTVGIGSVSGDKINLAIRLYDSTNAFSITTMALEKSYDFIKDWNSFVDKTNAESSKNVDYTVFDLEKVRIIGEISIPFMEFICDNFYAIQHHVLAELAKESGSPNMRNKILDIKRIYIDAPITRNEYEWDFLKAKQGKLLFYSRKVDKDRIPLYYEKGFILKTSADVSIKMPVSGAYIKYDTID